MLHISVLVRTAPHQVRGTCADMCGELSLLHMIVCPTSVRRPYVGLPKEICRWAPKRLLQTDLFSSPYKDLISGVSFSATRSPPRSLIVELDVPIPKSISRSSMSLSISFARRAYHPPGNANLFLYHLLQSFPVGNNNLNLGRTSVRRRMIIFGRFISSTHCTLTYSIKGAESASDF
jgi:hypothetical protein